MAQLTKNGFAFRARRYNRVQRLLDKLRPMAPVVRAKAGEA